MPLVDPDALGDVACARIYMAGRLREARRVEALLDEAGVDYFVEIEKFHEASQFVIGFLFDLRRPCG